MTNGNRIFVVSATAQAANNRMRMIPEPTRSDYGIIPVLSDVDMRGREVISGDLVLVVGDWSGRPHHVVKRLVDMFNTRRGGDGAPRLVFRAGEAPEVVYATPTTDSTIEVQTLNGNKYTFGVETTVPPAVITTTTSSAVAWNEVLEPRQQQIVADAVDAAKRERAIAADMREQVKKVQIQNKELRSWLSGVLPVEDTEIPGIYWCAVCFKRLPEHLDGCPAAP